MTSASAGLESPVAEPRREVRFGLVLYGGISLAIYMYGVVLELWRLVRASRGEERNAYTELLKRAEVSAAVDVISGTSAGGINGVLLGKALATGADLAALRRFWVEAADLGPLIRGAEDLEPTSLLKSEYFEAKLAGAFDAMDRRTTNRPLAGSLDLFVSGTRLRGKPRRFRDIFGQDVDTLEFAKLFHLKYRQKGYNPTDREVGYDRNDFEHKDNGMLVEISRATSAFPGAFQPRRIVRGKHNQPLFLPDDPGAYYTDGGVLQNRPFTETIGTIFTRMSDRPVQRILLSLDPNPESFEAHDDPGDEPEVLDVVAKAMSGIPMYQSIASDLEALTRHNERVRTLNRLIGALEDRIREAFGDKVNAGTDDEFREFLSQQVLHEVYQELKRDAIGDDLAGRIAAAAGLDDTQRRIVRETIEARSKTADDGAAVLPQDRERAAAAARGRRTRFLQQFDDAFRLRRAQYLIEQVQNVIDDMPSVAGEDRAEREPFRAALRKLWASYDRMRSHRFLIFRGDNETARAVRALAQESGSALHAAAARVLDQVAAALDREMGAIKDDLLRTAREIDDDIARLHERRAGFLRPLYSSFLRMAQRYEIRDMLLYPVDELAGIGERVEIGFVRVAPNTATYVQKTPSQKLTGENLGFFGAFLSDRWRENDILWGRLDAAEVVTRVVLHDRPDEQEGFIRAAQDEICRAELPHVFERRPNLDYKVYLEREHKVGEEDVRHLPQSQRVDLALRAAAAARNMVRRLSTSGPRPTQPLFKWAGSALGTSLALVKHPAQAIWAAEPGARQFMTIALFAAFVLAVASFTGQALGLLTAAPIVRSAATAAILVYAIYVALLEVVERRRVWLVVLAVIAAAALFWREALAYLTAVSGFATLPAPVLSLIVIGAFLFGAAAAMVARRWVELVAALVGLLAIAALALAATK
jgi:patatin-related protein